MNWVSGTDALAYDSSRISGFLGSSKATSRPALSSECSEFCPMRSYFEEFQSVWKSLKKSQFEPFLARKIQTVELGNYPGFEKKYLLSYFLKLSFLDASVFLERGSPKFLDGKSSRHRVLLTDGSRKFFCSILSRVIHSTWCEKTREWKLWLLSKLL